MRSLYDHLFSKGKKRILSLDGGGVRGLVTIGLLEKLESILRRRYAGTYTAKGLDPDSFRLCDYFDLIGGTSTGGIIASMLSLGFKASEIREIYLKICPRVFDKRRGLVTKWFNPYSLFEPSFDSKEFKRAVDEIMDLVLERAGRKGHGEPLLESDLLRTGTALVMKRIDTGSVWVLTNNKRMKWWHPDTPHWTHYFEKDEHRFFANGNYPLGILARATASAPFLLEAAELAISPTDGTGVFLDGGATPFNNPALELFLMATLKQYDDAGQVAAFSPFGFDWEASEDQLFLYSLGTGSWRSKMSAEDYKVRKNWEKAKIALVSIIDDGMKSSLTWLQALSEPVEPVRIDGNLEDMRNLRISPHKFLTFQRVNIDMEAPVISSLLGEPISDEIRDRMRLLDNSDKANLARLNLLGKAAGERLVKEEHFPAAFDPF